MEKLENNVERELREIKSLLTELLKRNEKSKSESETRGIMRLSEISLKDLFEDEITYSISDVKRFYK